MTATTPEFVTPKQIVEQQLLPWKSTETIRRKASEFKVSNFGSKSRPVYDLKDFYWHMQRSAK